MVNLQKGLVGHWTMDDADTSGGTLYDSSAYDNHGTINGGVTTSVSGKIGDAFDFDGSEGTGITMGLSSPPPTTLCGWVNLDSTSAEAVVVNNPGFRGQNLYVQSGDAIAEVILDNNDNSIQARSSVSTGNWYHLVAVLDSNSGQVELYVNGQEKSSQSWDGTYDGDSNIDNIGTDELNAPEQPLDGKIDDVRVYNRALSANEVSALYNMRSQRHYNTSLLWKDYFTSNRDQKFYEKVTHLERGSTTNGGWLWDTSQQTISSDTSNSDLTIHTEQGNLTSSDSVSVKSSYLGTGDNDAAGLVIYDSSSTRWYTGTITNDYRINGIGYYSSDGSFTTLSTGQTFDSTQSHDFELIYDNGSLEFYVDEILLSSVNETLNPDGFGLASLAIGSSATWEYIEVSTIV